MKERFIALAENRSYQRVTNTATASPFLIFRVSLCLLPHIGCLVSGCDWLNAELLAHHGLFLQIRFFVCSTCLSGGPPFMTILDNSGIMTPSSFPTSVWSVTLLLLLKILLHVCLHRLQDILWCCPLMPPLFPVQFSHCYAFHWYLLRNQCWKLNTHGWMELTAMHCAALEFDIHHCTTIARKCQNELFHR